MPRGRRVGDWLKDAAPWIAALIASGGTYFGVRLQTAVENRKVGAEAEKLREAADQSLRTDLRETEKYLRQQLRDVEADNKTLRAENLELKAENLTLRAEFADFKRDTAREILTLKERLETAMQAMERGRQARELTATEVQALTERVRQVEEDQPL